MTKVNLYIFGLTPAPSRELGTSGGETRLLNLLKYSNSANFKITLIGTKIWADKFRQFHLKFKHKNIKFESKFQNKLSLSLYSIYLVIKCLITIRLDPKSIVYCGSDIFWEVLPACYYKLTMKGSVTWIQIVHHLYPDWRRRPGNIFINFGGFYLQQLSLFLINKFSDKIITENDFTKKYFDNRDYKKNNLLLTSNGVDYQKVKKNKTNKIQFEACFLGRLDPSKGIFDIPKIWNQVCQVHPRAKLVVVGNGDIKNIQMLNNQINKLKLNSNIKLTGFLSDDDKYKAIKQSKIFISPSHEEGWGIALAEAMACGLPIVCWNLHNYLSIFDNFPNYIIESNIKLFADKIIYLLDNSKIAKTQGLANKRFSKKFDFNNIYKKEIEFMKN